MGDVRGWGETLLLKQNTLIQTHDWSAQTNKGRNGNRKHEIQIYLINSFSIAFVGKASGVAKHRNFFISQLNHSTFIFRNF